MHVDRKRKRSRLVALFSKYLFVRIIDQWYSIYSTVGVTNLLTNNSIPMKVPDLFIDGLKSKENKNGIVSLEDDPRKIKLGQRVQVVGGQFDGKFGLYNGMSSRQRERVLLELLGQYVGVELNIGSQLELVAE